MFDPDQIERVNQRGRDGLEVLVQLPGGAEVPEGWAPVLAHYVHNEWLGKATAATLLNAYQDLEMTCSINRRAATRRAIQLGATPAQIADALRLEEVDVMQEHKQAFSDAGTRILSYHDQQLERVRYARDKLERAEREVANAVNGAKTGGRATWQEIGEALGMSKQAAHQRYTVN